jgi:hypothetical protein
MTLSRCCYTMLQINLTHANTPQAKGRIERSFKTDQDRMIKAMRLDNINSIEDANMYLKEVYIPRHNSRFERAPEIAGNSHRPINDINFYDVFCIRESRTIRNDWTIKFKNNLIQICDQCPTIVKPKDVVNVCQRIDGEIYITTIKAQRLDFKILESGLPTDKEPKPLKRRYKPAHRITIESFESTDPEKLGHFYLAEK